MGTLSLLTSHPPCARHTSDQGVSAEEYFEHFAGYLYMLLPKVMSNEGKLIAAVLHRTTQWRSLLSNFERRGPACLRGGC